MSRNLRKVSKNLQKRARFEQKLTEIYHFLQINVLLNWEVQGIICLGFGHGLRSQIQARKGTKNTNKLKIIKTRINTDQNSFSCQPQRTQRSQRYSPRKRTKVFDTDLRRLTLFFILVWPSGLRRRSGCFGGVGKEKKLGSLEKRQVSRLFPKILISVKLKFHAEFIAIFRV